MFSHEFHIQVVSSAHNEILNGLYKSLFNLLDYSKRYTISGDFNTFDSLLAHETILTKIRLQDSEGAKEDMIGHLESAQKKLTQEIQEYLNKKSM